MQQQRSLELKFKLGDLPLSDESNVAPPTTASDCEIGLPVRSFLTFKFDPGFADTPDDMPRITRL